MLRVLSIVAAATGFLLVGIGLVDPEKTSMDLLARALIWAILSVVTWAVSDLRLAHDHLPRP